MEAAISSSCYASRLRLIPFKRAIFTSLHPPSKALIFRRRKPWETPSLRRAIITFEKVPTRIVSASSSLSDSDDDLQPIEELPPKLEEIVKLFQSVDDTRAKIDQLIFYGKNLKPLDSKFKTMENKVEGCNSDVWIRAFLDEAGNVVYEADSNSYMVKGLAAVLVQGLSGRPEPEISRVRPDLAVHLGQSVSPSRNSGFINMLRLMQKKARLLAANPEEKSSSEEETSVPEVDSVSEPSVPEDLIRDSKNLSKVIALGSRGMRIRGILEKELNPVELDVKDDDGGETHFKLRIVSDGFQGKSLVKRHRLVYDLLQEELKSGLHALSIVAKTPA